jgi:hypothetical protein
MITTLDLPQEIVTQAQGIAKARKTTLQALVVEGLQSVLRGSESTAAATPQALARLRAGLNMGGGEPLTRDQAHAR